MKEINPTEDLEFIKKIIQDSKRAVVENGIGYIVWGILIFLGLLGTYLKFRFRLDFEYMYVWISLIGIGWVYSIIEGVRARKRNCVKTFSGKMIGQIWFAVGIALTIIGLVGISSGSIQGQYFSPISAVLIGIGFFLTGTVSDTNWVKIVSLIWWTSSVVMFFLDGLTNLLILTLLMVTCQILPGVIIYLKYKKEMKSENE